MSEYTIRQGKIYSFHEGLLSNVVAEIIYQKKEEFFKDEFNKLNLYISGIEYYTFMQSNKKYVTEIVFVSNEVKRKIINNKNVREEEIAALTFCL